MDENEALIELRKLHKNYVRSCGKRFAHLPFRATAVPGWVYMPDGVARDEISEPILSSAEQKAQGSRCGCAGADDYCVCQNVPDRQTRAERAKR